MLYGAEGSCKVIIVIIFSAFVTMSNISALDKVMRSIVN